MLLADTFDLDRIRKRYYDYFRFREGDLEKLYIGPRTQANGLAYFTSIESRLNYFASVSRFYEDTLVNDVKLEQSYQEIYEELVYHWSVVNEFCLITVNGTPAVIRPDYVFPISNQSDYRTVLGYIFIFPIVEEWNNDVQVSQAKVISYDAMTGDSHEGYANYSEGGNLSGITYTGRSMVDSVYWHKTEEPIYRALEPLVKEINIRLHMMSASMNSSAFPIIIGNFQNNDRSVDINLVRERSGSGLGLIFQTPFTGEVAPYYLERGSVETEAPLRYINFLMNQAALLSGVPDYVVGADLRRTDEENERVLFTGQNRIARFKKAVSIAFRQMGQDVEFQSPYTTRATNTKVALSLFDRGIITVDEVRDILGIAVNGDSKKALASGQSSDDTAEPMETADRAKQ